MRLWIHKNVYSVMHYAIAIRSILVISKSYVVYLFWKPFAKICSHLSQIKMQAFHKSIITDLRFTVGISVDSHKTSHWDSESSTADLLIAST